MFLRGFWSLLKQFAATLFFLGIAHAFSAMELTARPPANDFTLDQHGQFGPKQHQALARHLNDDATIEALPQFVDQTHLILLAVRRPEQQVAFLQFRKPYHNNLAMFALAECSRRFAAESAVHHFNSVSREWTRQASGVL